MSARVSASATSRTYSSPQRSADAARTRAAILDAVATLCSRDGYAATTLKAIAAEAGVSLPSVTLAGSKAALLIAAFERRFSGDEGRQSLAERPAMAEIMALPDTEVAVGRWLDYVADANRATAALSRAMVTAAEADALAAVAVEDLAARRASDMQLAAGWCAHRGLIDPADVATTAIELGYLIGPETYAYFVEQSRWSGDEYRRWLERSLRHVLPGLAH